MPHPLDPLLRPDSIAVLGASERPGSVGRQTVENLLHGAYSGSLYAVNPGYETVCGVPCYAKLAQLPEPVEHFILAVGDQHIEEALQAVIQHGAKAATILTGLVLKDDHEPLLKDRIQQLCQESGLLLCGAGSMGYYNFQDGVWACGFDTRDNHRRGGITLISQSGSGMSGLVDADERMDCNLAISSGLELTVGIDQYLDFALDQPATRVVGLFIETIRNPAAMIRALEKANQRAIPLVALKVGRTEFSARMAVTHSGAIAGRDTAYQALFDRYGVQRVSDMDELATTLIMFAQPHPVASGGLVALHDSGGERQLLIDLAERRNVPLAEISPATCQRLEQLLDPGLPAVNPLDAWGAGGPGSDQIMADCFSTMLTDDQAALGAVIHDRGPKGIYGKYLNYLHQGHQSSGKPVFLVSNRQGTGADPRVQTSTRRGFPVLDGLQSFLTGVRCLLAYRDFQSIPVSQDQPAVAPNLPVWRDRLAAGETLQEAAAGQLLSEAGLPVNPSRLADDETGVRSAAREFTFPVVLKSAADGLLHRARKSGVVLNIKDETSLAAAFRDLTKRLGKPVLVAPMVTEPGVEMMLGMIRDQQFGPLVVLGFGGVDVESVRDLAHALPPFDRHAARRLLESLNAYQQQATRLDGLALDEFCRLAASFSALAARHGDVIAEMDLNPVIVHADGCIVVDALIRGEQQDTDAMQRRQTG